MSQEAKANDDGVAGKQRTMKEVRVAQTSCDVSTYGVEVEMKEMTMNMTGKRSLSKLFCLSAGF